MRGRLSFVQMRENRANELPRTPLLQCIEMLVVSIAPPDQTVDYRCQDAAGEPQTRASVGTLYRCCLTSFAIKSDERRGARAHLVPQRRSITMSLRAPIFYCIPEETERVARAAFPK